MRKIERHPSNQGSVITFDMFGKQTHLFVADAKYRTCEMCNSYSFRLKPEIDIDDYLKFFSDNNCFSDKAIQNYFNELNNDLSAKENSEILWLQMNRAVEYCRNIEIENIGELDLPNFYELIIIFSESERLDEMDITRYNFPEFSLSEINFTKEIKGVNPYFHKDKFNFIFNQKQTGCCSSTSLIGGVLATIGGNLFYESGVIPVKEL